MKKIMLVAAVLFISLGSFANQSIELDSSSGEVEFLAKGPLVKVNGKGDGAKGVLNIKDDKASGSLVLDLNSLHTGISLRDDHMKNKYLHIDKHPTATLKLVDVALPKNLKGKAKFKGFLTLHGITKEVSGKMKMKGVKSGKAQINAEFKIKFSDFNIELPAFKLVSVGEDIKIKVSSKAAVKNTTI